MPDLCLCCGKMPLQSSEVGPAERRSRLERIPERVRQQLPKDELEALLRKDRALHLDLCGLCNSLGCDNIAPCRVPADRWVYLAQIPLLNAAWQYAHAWSAVGSSIVTGTPNLQ